MKKTLLTMVLAASMVSGCSMIGGQETVSYEDLKHEGAELAVRSNGDNYVPSVVKEAEIARIAVNTAFLASKPAYERYTEELLATPALGNYFSAVEAVDSEEEKRAIYDSLTEEDKKVVDNYMASSVFSEVIEGLKDAALPATKSVVTFMAMDQTDLLDGVEFSALLTEKDKFALTAEQALYINETVVSAYENYQIISAFSAAK
ncbi:conserved exported hypothetical protein [Vibrio chagasii]|uniref:hypothetical protein n=1 Tax=Vibrio chagasii TaxID=170679 RepID=UPI001641DDC3|nr:hypothetical protein [Vibrio chagasii]CAH6977053.1 conserved exported hypothetical protein [Vibrio chagasii]CAH6981236.1 conserved exported hypothetical protein [Vibrio chagasii]CAH6982862.1 conserved exported hypothetical protein [Vibrio chagasii]CAH7011085.1 conserved exported hypothetical protein [Vibrio chagasii]CAH7180389.1 conserved exported hypothetical protein [Vibrio chagasii]